MKKTFPLLLSLVVLLFAGCNKETPEIDNPDNPDKPQSVNVVVMEKKMVEEKIDTIHADGTIIFSALSALETPKKGDIICSAPAEGAPQGFLYRVLEVKTESGKTTIKTEFAFIEEAVENAEVNQSFDLTQVKGMTILNDQGEIIPFTYLPPTRNTVSFGVKFDIEKKGLFGIDSAFVKGSASFGLNLDVKLSIKNHNTRELSFVLSPQLETDLIAGFEIEGKKEYRQLLFEHRTPPIFFYAGAIPVVITPRIGFYLYVSAKGTLEISAKILEIEAKPKFDFSYRNDAWETYGFNKGDNEEALKVEFFKNLELNLSGEIESGLEIEKLLDFYNTGTGIGNSLNFYGKLKFEIPVGFEYSGTSPTVEPKMTLTTGINDTYKAQVKIFKKTLGELKGTTEIIKWDVWEKPVLPVFSELTHTNNNDGSTTVSCEIEKLPLTFFDILQHGFSWAEGENAAPTIVNSPFSQLGALPFKRGETEGKQPMQVTLTNLKSNTAYTIRPYYTSWLGTFYPKSYTFTTSGTAGETHPPLALDKTALTLAVGESATVAITSGSGVYSAESGNAAIAAATLFDTRVTVHGVAEGTSTITVTDKQSNQTAIIAVTVTKKEEDNPPTSGGSVILNFATHNVGKTPGTFAPNHNNDASGYYTWEQAKTACPTGYHLPTKGELQGLLPNYNDEAYAAYWGASYNVSNRVENDVTLNGVTKSYTSDFFSTGNGIGYAIRFKTGTTGTNPATDNFDRTAYRYQWVEGGILTSHLKITTVYLGSAFTGSINDVSNEAWWTARAAEAKSLVLPAVGHDSGIARGTYGYYWSSAEYSSAVAPHAGFHSTAGNLGYSNKSYAFTVRCVRE